MNMLKKYLTMMLLLGLACPATACNSSSSSEDEVPPHLKPETPEEPGRDYYPCLLYTSPSPRDCS